MTCFCRSTARDLARLGAPAGPAAPVSERAAAQARALTAFDAAQSAGTPGIHPAMSRVQFPPSPVSLPVAATVAAYAQLQAQLAAAGIVAGTAQGMAALTRLTGTLNARLADAPRPDTAAWTRLAQLDRAATSAQALAGRVAAERAGAAGSATRGGPAGTGAVAPSRSPAVGTATTPPALAATVANLRSLSLLMAAAAQLGIRLDAAAEVSAQVQAMAALDLPRLPPERVAAAAALTAGLSARQSLADSLGIDPAATPLAAVQPMVMANVDRAVQALSRAGIDVTKPPPEVPGLPAFATREVLRDAFALNARAVASLSLDVRASAGLSSSLVVTSLAAQLPAAGGQAPSATPCTGCDWRQAVAGLAG